MRALGRQLQPEDPLAPPRKESAEDEDDEELRDGVNCVGWWARHIGDQWDRRRGVTCT